MSAELPSSTPASSGGEATQTAIDNNNHHAPLSRARDLYQSVSAGIGMPVWRSDFRTSQQPAEPSSSIKQPAMTTRWGWLKRVFKSRKTEETRDNIAFAEFAPCDDDVTAAAPAVLLDPGHGVVEPSGNGTDKTPPSVAVTSLEECAKLTLLPIARTSKATVATASTALSTVHTHGTSHSPSFTLHSGGTQGTPATYYCKGDEFSYSCANSTAWTSTPSPKQYTTVVLSTSNTKESAATTPPFASAYETADSTAGASNDDATLQKIREEGRPDADALRRQQEQQLQQHHQQQQDMDINTTERKEDEKKNDIVEEEDGFVELITERQRSRRYSQEEPAPTSTDNITAVISTTPESTAETADEPPLQGTSQGYYALGYNLLGFHPNNPFQSTSTGTASQEKDESQLTNASQARTASTISKTNGTSTDPAVVGSRRSESPEKPPNTRRKNVDQEFFMGDAAVPPSPTNEQRQRKQQQQQQREQQVLEKETIEPQPHHDGYGYPHLYAEINVKHRLRPVTRQGSEGTASLAMTSISSITGHGSLFAKDNDESGGRFSPTGELWRIGSAMVDTAVSAAAQENYFDYSNDETLKDHRKEKVGLMEWLGGTVTDVFHSACQCFEVNHPPVSPEVFGGTTATTLVGDESPAVVPQRRRREKNTQDEEPKFSSLTVH